LIDGASAAATTTAAKSTTKSKKGGGSKLDEDQAETLQAFILNLLAENEGVIDTRTIPNLLLKEFMGDKSVGPMVTSLGAAYYSESELWEYDADSGRIGLPGMLEVGDDEDGDEDED